MTAAAAPTPAGEPAEDRTGRAARLLAAHPWIAAATPGTDGGVTVEIAAAALASRPVAGDLLRAYLAQWGELYDLTYDGTDRTSAADLDLAGWCTSDTGAAFAPEDMREWVDATVALVRSTRPRLLLELGCGTGLLAHRLAPVLDGYVGADLSATAVERLTAAGLPRSRFVVAGAHEARGPAVAAALAAVGAPHGAPDCVVLNSVSQCLGSLEHLGTVVAAAVEIVADGGSVVVGDVRHAGLLTAFTRWVERTDDSGTDLAARTAARLDRDPQLCLDPAALTRLAASPTRRVRMRALPKFLDADTELSRFRFDAVLRVDPDDEPTPRADRAPWRGVPALAATLRAGRPAHVAGIPHRLLDPRPGAVTPSELAAMCAGRDAAVVGDERDPAALAVVLPAAAAEVPVPAAPRPGRAHQPLLRFARHQVRRAAHELLARELPAATDVPAVDVPAADVPAADVPVAVRRPAAWETALDPVTGEPDTE